MQYELWDQDTANLVGAFDTEAAALAFVRDATGRSPTVALTWALAIEDEDAETTPIAAGRALIDRAFEPQHA